MKELHVNIGEVKVVDGSTKLKTLLGSCVGIAIIWPEKDKYGLAHCLLPSEPEPSVKITARFVDSAVRSLISLLKVSPEEIPQIYAIIAGGANMTGGKRDPKLLVGEKNGKAAVSELRKRRIKIRHRDLGGNEGRRMSVFGAQVDIESVPQEVAAS